jgi:type IX secretion system PorP/SprF family membrane protein
MVKKISAFFLTLLPMLIWTQQDTQIAFFKKHLQLYNPAATGLENQMILSSTIRSQWSDVKGAPNVQLFNLSIPEGEKRLGYGALLMMDKTFIEHQTRLFASFSYRLPIGEKNSLYLGVQGGGNHMNLNFNDLNLAHKDDGKLENLTRFYPNIGVGVYYKMEKGFFSFSAPMLFGHKNKKNNEAISPSPLDDPHLYLSVGIRYPAFAENWKYIVYTLVRWVDNAPTSSVINAGLAYQKSELLFIYHHNSGLGVSELFDNGGPISVGYAYQFSTFDLLSKLHYGNHELTLRIRFNNKKIESKELDADEKSKDKLTMN